MGLTFQETVEHSPQFRNALANSERDLDGIEKRMTRILNLLLKKEEQNRQMLHTSNLINQEFEQMMTQSTCSLKHTLKTYIGALQHWDESNERHMEQTRMVLIEPLSDFMQTDFKKIELRKTQYHTAVKEHVSCSEQYAECKQEDVPRLHAASQTLFTAQYNMTRLAARYVLNLKTFFTKKDIFLTSQLSELITTYLSHHQLGSNIALEVESQREKLTNLLVDTKTELDDTTNSLRSEFRTVLSRNERTQTMKLLNLQLYDLHMSDEATKTAAKLKEFTNVEEISSPIPRDNQIRGYLWVGDKSTLIGYTWHRYWCCVQDGMLNMVSNEKAEQRINLKLCQVKSDAYNIHRGFCFSLFSPVRPLILQTESSQEKETWVMVIHKAIANAISKQVAIYSISDKNSKNNSKKKDNVIPLSVLRELQEVPGNLICADCAKKKPTWASLNLGVLICIECSGIHRGLGVQLSQVRSLTLDALSAEQVEMLRLVGNSMANQIYEAELDCEKTLTTHAERKDFIHQKYVDLTFTSSQFHDLIVESRSTGAQKTLVAVQKVEEKLRESSPTTTSTSSTLGST